MLILMKNFLKILFIYLIVIGPVISFYISLNNQNQEELKLTKKELNGLEYLKSLYSFSISLSFYKESIAAGAHADKIIIRKEKLNKDINSIYALREKYPQFKSKELHQHLHQLEASQFRDLEYYQFLDFINHENYRIGDISGLLFEKDRKVHFLASLITHYMPEYLISLLVVHNHVEEFIVDGNLSEEQKNIYTEQYKLMQLSTDELYEIIELLKPYKETEELFALISQIHSRINFLSPYTKSISQWKQNDKELSDYLTDTYHLIELSFDLNHKNFTIMKTSLDNRVNSLEETILRDKLILLILVLIITSLAFYFYHINRASIEKDLEIKEINKILDKFVVFSKTDRQGHITYTSTALEKLTGYTKNELLGKTHGLFKDSDTDSTIFKEMWATILSKKEWQGELKNRSKDGSSYWVRITITPILDSSDTITGFSSYRENISNEKALEHEKEKTQKALEFKAMFLSNMSHEIRTPLNGIIGFTHLAQETDLNSKQKGIIKNIQSASDLLLGIINDILDISKIESGKMTLEHIPFNLKSSIENLEQLFKNKAEEKNISLVIDYGDVSNFNILGDSLKLSQILTNLLSNAIKFTEKGSVTLRLTLIDEQNALFEVIDTGIGLKESQLQTLFEEFTQADMSTSRKYGGTGLGLAISKNLVQMMGSELKVDSHFGEGCTFSFVLKMEASNVEIENKTQNEIKLTELAEEVNALKGRRILVAEDNKMNQMLLGMLLEESTLQLDFANDGQLAVEKLKENNYDLILMDIQMPNMNGYEATKTIRKTNQNIPIIALSANVMQEDIDKSIQSGMNEHLAKPIEIEKLYKILLKYLNP